MIIDKSTLTYCCITVPPTQNRSDTDCALKIANWIKERSYFKKIFIATDQPQNFAGCNFEIISFDKRPSKLALQVLAPVSNFGFVTPFLSQDIKNLLLFEYGYASECPEDTAEIVAKSFGIHDNELGIFIHENLTHLDLPKSKLFQNLSDEIQKEILRLKTKDQAWDLQWKMYTGFSYSQQAIADFLYAIAQLNQNDDKNILIILPDVLHLNLGVYLEDFDFGSLTTRYYNGSFFEESKSVFKSANKKIDIFHGKFTSNDVDLLFALSEPQTIVMGDISLSKAISLNNQKKTRNKRFIYIEDNNKRTFGNALQKHYTPQTVTLEYEDERFNAPKAQEMFEIFSKTDLRQFYSSTELLIKRNNCHEKLSNLFKQIL